MKSLLFILVTILSLYANAQTVEADTVEAIILFSSAETEIEYQYSQPDSSGNVTRYEVPAIKNPTPFTLMCYVVFLPSKPGQFDILSNVLDKNFKPLPNNIIVWDYRIIKSK